MKYAPESGTAVPLAARDELQAVAWKFFSTGEFSERSVGPGRQPVRRELMARRHMERFLKNRASLKSC